MSRLSDDIRIIHSRSVSERMQLFYFGSVFFGSDKSLPAGRQAGDPLQRRVR